MDAPRQYDFITYSDLKRHLTRQTKGSSLATIPHYTLSLSSVFADVIGCVCVSISRLVSTVHALIVGLFCLYILWFDDVVNANPVW